MRWTRKKPKVVLINPYQFGLYDRIAYPPLGILSIASYLEKKGIKVQVLNFANKRNIGKKDIPFAKYYGVTCVTPTFSECQKICRVIRKKNPKATIVVGGVHPTVEPYDTAKRMDCDIVCIGEGELTMLEIVQGKRLDLIKGIIIVTRDLGKEVYTQWTGKRYLIKNLDDLPFPARHLLPEWQIKHKKGVHLDSYSEDATSTSISLSRGCPYRCAFCCKGHEMFSVVRYRSGRNIAKEIGEIKKRFKISHYRINDDILTINRERLYDICRHLRSLNIFWSCITRADAIDDEKCRIMYDAGCREMAIGVESGSDRILKILNKKETTKQMKKSIKIIKANNIKVKVFLIHGLPTETKKDIELTKKFMIEVKPSKWTLSRFVPLPGSEIYLNPEKYGISRDSIRNTNCWYYPKSGWKDAKKYKSFFEMEKWLKSEGWKK